MKLRSDLSHELRTPLTAIQGALDLLDTGRLGTLSDQGRRMVEIAATNVDRLMRLITALEQAPELFTTLLSIEELARLRLETELKSALIYHELKLRYQPLVALSSGQIIGFEAVLCWQHPALGFLLPEQFIAIAEATNLAVDMGRWVLHEACSQLQTWQQKFPEQFNFLSISVNLSSKQLACSDLVQQVSQVLQETKLSADSLKLEITETAAMGCTEPNREALMQLRDLGVQFCIDDFGVGHSSLGKLYDLPPDILKIDRSLIQQLNSKRGEYLVWAIASLAHSLGINVIAEGVETEAQVQKLQALGCGWGQGDFFSILLDRDAVTTFIKCSLQNCIS
jgi:c-di-GMP phosphodiesterase